MQIQKIKTHNHDLKKQPTVNKLKNSDTDKKFSTVKNFLWYSLSSSLIKSTNIAIMPIILSRLTTAEFGLLSLINTFINILSLLLGLGLKQIVGIEFFHCNKKGT